MELSYAAFSFIERAENAAPALATLPKRASDNLLAFIRA